TSAYPECPQDKTGLSTPCKSSRWCRRKSSYTSDAFRIMRVSVILSMIFSPSCCSGRTVAFMPLQPHSLKGGANVRATFEIVLLFYGPLKSLVAPLPLQQSAFCLRNNFPDLLCFT